MTFDKYYRAYDERYRRVYALGARTWRQSRVDEELQRFLKVRGLPPGDAIDLGCGEGIDSIWLAARGWRVVGVDLSATAIDRARELTADAGVVVEFQVGDVLNLSAYVDHSFDLAVNVFTLHMLVEREDRLRHLREAHRVLRRDGWLFLDNLGRSRVLEGRALPAGQPTDCEIVVAGQIVRVVLPAVASTRLTDRQVRDELGEVGFAVRRLYRVGSPDYRRIICWAQKALPSAPPATG